MSEDVLRQMKAGLIQYGRVMCISPFWIGNSRGVEVRSPGVASLVALEDSGAAPNSL